MKGQLVDPLHIFLTGQAGCVKSSVAKLVYKTVAKVFSYTIRSSDKPDA